MILYNTILWVMSLVLCQYSQYEGIPAAYEWHRYIHAHHVHLPDPKFEARPSTIQPFVLFLRWPHVRWVVPWSMCTIIIIPLSHVDVQPILKSVRQAWIRPTWHIFFTGFTGFSIVLIIRNTSVPNVTTTYTTAIFFCS